MNSNYEWQKHQANERLNARMKEAEAHRRAKQGPRPPRPFLLAAGRTWNRLRSLFRRTAHQQPSRRRAEFPIRKRPASQ